MSKLSIRIVLMCLCLCLWSNSELNAQTEPILEIPQSRIGNVMWSADGSSVVLVDNQNIIFFNQQLEKIDQFYIGLVQQVSLSPDGHYAALARWTGSIELWDVHNWTLIHEVRSGSEYLKSMDWSPDSTMLAVTEMNSNVIEIWDIHTSQLLKEIFIEADQTIQSFKWKPDSKQLAIAYKRYSVVIWDIDTAQVVARFDGHQAYIVSIAWSPDGQWVASSGNTFECTNLYDGSEVWVWNAATGAVLNFFETLHCSLENPLTWSPDGVSLAGTTETGSAPFSNWTTYLQVWDVISGETVKNQKISEHDSVVELSWQPDGENILFGTHFSRVGGFGNFCASPVVGVVSISDDSSLIYEPVSHGGSILSLDWSPDSNSLATASTDRNIIIWNTNTGEAIIRLSGHECTVEHIAWNPVTNQLASTGADWNVHLWDVETGENLYTSEFIWSNLPEVQILSWNSSGTRLVTFDFDGRGRVWDDKLNVLYDFQLPFRPPFPLYALTWKGDSPLIAIAKNPIELWSISETPVLEKTFPISEYRVRSLEWNTTGMFLAILNENNTVDIWGKDGSYINTIFPEYEISHLLWHPEENFLGLYSNDESQLNIYDLETGNKLKTLEVSASLLAWNSDGTKLAVINWENLAVQIWDF